MKCTRPIKAYRPKSGDGKLVFDTGKGWADTEMEIECGRCTPCRIKKRQILTLRSVHESKMHSENCFITPTYDPEHLPKDRGLHQEHGQQFIKNLRRNLARKYPGRGSPRYLIAGEYGEKPGECQYNPFTGKMDTRGRPHYHLNLFGFMPPDCKPAARGSRGDILYESDLINKCWGKGRVQIGELTRESAGYTTGYAMKKLNSAEKDNEYKFVDPQTGEEHLRAREFCNWSNRPGLGSPFFDKFPTDFFKGFITLGNSKVSISGTYYEQKLEKYCTENDDYYPVWEAHLEKKRISVNPDHPDNTPERRQAIEQCVEERIKFWQNKHL